MSNFFGWVRDLMAAIGFLTVSGVVFWTLLDSDSLKATLNGGEEKQSYAPPTGQPLSMDAKKDDYFKSQEAKVKLALEAHDLQGACSLALVTAQRARDTASKSLYRDWVQFRDIACQASITDAINSTNPFYQYGKVKTWSEERKQERDALGH